MKFPLQGVIYNEDFVEPNQRDIRTEIRPQVSYDLLMTKIKNTIFSKGQFTWNNNCCACLDI